MTKLCLIAHHDYFNDPRLRRYVDALADAGAHVDVLCLRAETPAPQRDGVRVFTIPLRHGWGGRGRYLLEYGAALVLFMVWLSVLHIRHRYQLIQVHNIPDFLVFAALIPRIFGVKLVLDNRDPMPEFYMSRFSDPRANSRIVRLMKLQEKLSSMLAHVLIAANATFKDNLVKRGIAADKITVINNLPDAQVFSRERHKKTTRHPGAPFTLIYPGTIAPRYGLEVAVRALPLLREKIPNLRLVIIGAQTDHVGELAALAEQHEVSSIIEFKSPVPVDAVPQHLVEADVGIYPALPDPHMSIATPTKVLEYAAMGIPIVASRLRVLEDLFDDQSLLFFEPGNVEAFAQHILELYEHPARRDELVRNADATFVHRHRWCDERQVYLGVLNRLLASKDPALVIGDAVTGPAGD